MYSIWGIDHGENISKAVNPMNMIKPVGAPKPVLDAGRFFRGSRGATSTLNRMSPGKRQLATSLRAVKPR